MNFQPELAKLILSCDKVVTRRRMSTNPRSPWYEGGCKLKVGRDYAVCPGRGKHAIGRIEIVNFYARALDLITLPEAKREGFDSVEHFVAGWSQMHGDWDSLEVVWRVEFKLLVRGEQRCDLCLGTGRRLLYGDRGEANCFACGGFGRGWAVDENCHKAGQIRRGEIPNPVAVAA